MASTIASETASTPSRLSQTQRSSAMRLRLQDATIEQLIAHGYAQTSVSAICKSAAVSRGAFVHHYPSKQGLMEDVARKLVLDSNRRLGKVLSAVNQDEDFLRAFVHAAWSEIFSTPLYRAYRELVNASQSDPELNRYMKKVSRDMLKLLDQAVEHYFEPVGTGHFKITDLFLLSRWLLGGISSNQHLIDNPHYIRSQLDLWLQLLQTQIRPKPGATPRTLKQAFV